MTPTPFTRWVSSPNGTSAGKVARAARQSLSPTAVSSSWAAQLPRLASVLAGAFRRGEA